MAEHRRRSAGDPARGALIRRRREALGISPEAMAGWLRMSTQSLRRVELGESDFRSEELYRFAALVDVSPMDLVPKSYLRALALEARTYRPLMVPKPGRKNGSKNA